MACDGAGTGGGVGGGGGLSRGDLHIRWCTGVRRTVGVGDLTDPSRPAQRPAAARHAAAQSPAGSRPPRHRPAPTGSATASSSSQQSASSAQRCCNQGQGLLWPGRRVKNGTTDGGIFQCMSKIQELSFSFLFYLG